MTGTTAGDQGNLTLIDLLLVDELILGIEGQLGVGHDDAGTHLGNNSLGIVDDLLHSASYASL